MMFPGTQTREINPMKTIWPVAAATLLAAACAASSGSAPAQAEIGRRAPDIEWSYLQGGDGSSLSDLRGRVVLVEFWRTW